MLSAAVLGNVFASPSVASILAALRVVAGSLGVLMIVKNYTGDRLNFGMAAEIAKQEGIDVKMVIVADDCALPLGKGITGGRGLSGSVYVHKVAGASAATGASLAEVHAAATEATARIGTLGIALTTCSVPGTPASTRLSQPGLIEVGMGIHGEPGREQMQLPETGAADQIAAILVAGILDPPVGETQQTSTSAVRRLPFVAGQRVAVMVNNLGALPVIELQIVTRGIMLELARRGLVPVRAHVGPLVTSLEMSGLSLTLFVIENDGKSQATLPIKPMKLPRNMGVWAVYPKYTTDGNYEYDKEFIPLQMGQGGLIKSQPLLSDLLNQVGYECFGDKLFFTKDIKSLFPDIVLAMRLAVMDISQYGDWDILPLLPEHEMAIKQEVIKLFSVVGTADLIVDDTSKQQQGLPVKEQKQTL